MINSSPMVENILISENFDLISEDDQLYLQFKQIKDKPKFIFESLEKYLYEDRGQNYINELANELQKNPAVYDQRLTYSYSQSIAPPRETFYLQGSYYCQNHNQKSKNILDNIKYAIGMYSDGKSIQAISNYIKSVLTQASFLKIDLKDRSQYYLISSLVCLARLLEIEDLDENKELISLISQDRLLHMYFFTSDKPNIELPILHQDPYLFLSLELTTPENHIDQFCKNFYNSLKPVSWHNKHMRDFSDFFGYWSFELAYLVRFLDVIDATFLDHMYYPRDLAFRKWVPTWRDDKIGEEAREYKKQFLENKQQNTNDLTAEILAFVEKEMENTFQTVLSTDLFKKAMSKIAQSNELLSNLGDDLSKREFDKIRSIIKDLVEILTDYSEDVKENKHLKNVESEMKARVIQQFDKKKYSRQKIERKFSEYIKSEHFNSMAKLANQNIEKLTEELLKAQEVEEESEFWDGIDEIFNKYGLFDVVEKSESKLNQNSEKTKDSLDIKESVSFKISFNDYL